MLFICLLAVSLAFYKWGQEEIILFLLFTFFLINLFFMSLQKESSPLLFLLLTLYIDKTIEEVFFLVRQTRDTIYHRHICQHDASACLYFLSLLVVHLKSDYNWLVLAFKLLWTTLHPLLYKTKLMRLKSLRGQFKISLFNKNCISLIFYWFSTHSHVMLLW